ncbi:hypothetical protein C922_05098 [Plasmodium inui San Antonio 1]|uniref:Uncharacterized protein n=1 Tax=Plasmodium inui San Antonio 1 TaxID=1237626 RepID=W7AGY6_9APIC|nr:hypothetical protein C922_05098 [Plasmodium inui San Antonio 1]EUD64536.1 hypothetical protein C922_05098 [Plasmodium inui San Antonio 1]
MPEEFQEGTQESLPQSTGPTGNPHNLPDIPRTKTSQGLSHPEGQKDLRTPELHSTTGRSRILATAYELNTSRNQKTCKDEGRIEAVSKRKSRGPDKTAL